MKVTVRPSALPILLAFLVVSGVACDPAPEGDIPTSALAATAVPASYSENAQTSGSGLVPAEVVSQGQPPATFMPFPTVALPPTFTPEPIAPTPVPSPETYWLARNPLTGELAADPTILERRPIAVKISNAPARWTRPQSGLAQADLVFEHLTEGSITRFTAILYGQTPPVVGPIRSARLIDLELPAMYDAALAYSGSSIGVSRKLFDSDFRDRILRTNSGGYYRTGEKKPYEHTLYAEPELLWGTLENRGENHRPQYPLPIAFDQSPPAGGEPAGALTVQYYRFSTVEWYYDQSTGRYKRWADGEKHLDANVDRQISASNVVVLLAPHVLDETICENQQGDRCLAYSIEVQLLGAGRAVVLRDGRAYDVGWSRPTRNAMLTFYDANGRLFPLQTGNTWFQVVPDDYLEAYSVAAEAPATATPTPAAVPRSVLE